MRCLNCSSDKFETKNTRFNPEIREKEIEVVVPAFVCIKCQTPLMDTEQMDVLRRSAADEYKKRYGIISVAK